MNWKQIGVICGAIMGLAAVFGLVYKADCWNIKAKGAEHFATVETYLAGQKKIEKKFDSWELKEKQKEITGMDQVYGEGCARCDSKLKQYYDWLKLERDRLISAIKGSG